MKKQQKHGWVNVIGIGVFLVEGMPTKVRVDETTPLTVRAILIDETASAVVGEQLEIVGAWTRRSNFVEASIRPVSAAWDAR